MIQPSEICISDLPSLPLNRKNELPKHPGIYFAIDSTGTVQYIGMAKDIKSRWLFHHREMDLEDIGGVSISYLEVSNPQMLRQIEKALIAWFNPPLNGTKITKRPPRLTGKGAPGLPRVNRQKAHKRKTIKLDSCLVPFAENSLNGTTSTIELGLSMIEHLAEQSLADDKQAIELLARFGVEAKIEECSPIVVYKPDREIGAWIV